ncbi:MAG: response regulator, partial [Desulfobacterales bacterium]|nr:response regulator [Desulfobacterales bacterium]
IIKKHGGLINVESELGKGSNVSICLPAFTVKEPDLQKPEKKPAPQEHVKQSATSKGKILLMDDEKMIRSFMDQMLSRSGYDVETCVEGKKAVEIYKKAMESKEPFDVVILDLSNKFGMGGKETMKRLLEIDHNARGIVITGYSDDPAVTNFTAYGFSGFVTKPATKNELNRVINEVISKNQ